jgi:hypothetical protein
VKPKDFTAPINRMTILIKDTQSNQEQILEDVTIEHIMYCLNWVKKEKARQSGKYQLYIKPKREALREAILEAQPKPEPTPEPPAKRPRGRPRKYPVEVSGQNVKS